MELGVSSCYVMGTGGGALAALHFAGAHAKRHGLTDKGMIADSFLARWQGKEMHRQLNRRDHYYRRQAKSLHAQHGDDWQQVVDGDTSFLRVIANQGGYEIPEFILNSIECPVLLTGHLQDPATPGSALEYARMASIIPDCTIHLASKSGHPFIEHPFMWSDQGSFRGICDLFFSKAKLS